MAKERNTQGRAHRPEADSELFRIVGALLAAMERVGLDAAVRVATYGSAFPRLYQIAKVGHTEAVEWLAPDAAAHEIGSLNDVALAAWATCKVNQLGSGSIYALKVKPRWDEKQCRRYAHGMPVYAD